MFGNNIKINKVLLIETGSYNTQYRRSYDTHLEGNAMNTILEKLSGVNKYSPSLMSTIAGQFISPTATPEKPLELINGWNERRMRFMMEIEFVHRMGAKVTQVILGYTEYSGVSLNASIDPRMTFYINSVMQTKSTI